MSSRTARPCAARFAAARTRTTRAAAFALTLGALLAATAVPASAAITHKRLFTFGSGTAPTVKEKAALSILHSIAIVDASGATEGDVYVGVHGGLANGENMLDRFKVEGEKGEYDCQITGAGSESMSGTECDPTGTAAPGEAVGEPLGVAVDPEGNVFATSFLTSKVNEFEPSGSWLAPQISAEHPASLAFGTAGELLIGAALRIYKYDPTTEETTTLAFNLAFSLVDGLAVDTDAASPAYGDIYVYKSGALNVVSPSGALLKTVSAPEGDTFTGSGGVAVDPATGDVYVADGKVGGWVSEYSPGASSLISQIPTPSTGAAAAVAINALNGDVYVGDTGTASIEVYGPNLTIPTVALEAVSEVEDTTATLAGEVQPAGGGEVTTCVFEYGEGAVAEHSVPCAPPTPYSADTAVSAALTGLTQSTTYSFRLKAEDANGANVTETGSFTTAGPAIVESASVNPGAESAIFRGTIDPNGTATTCELQYVDQASFEASEYTNAKSVACTPSSLGSGRTNVEVIAKARGLEVATVYHYRFVGVNEAGAAGGADQEFATFGMKAIGFEVTNAEREPYTQAGGHPFAMTTSIEFNSTASSRGVAPNGNVKDVEVQLPTGFVGNPSATTKCSRYESERFQCSAASQVGVLVVTVHEGGGAHRYEVPLHNLVPPAGVAAQFGARINDFANAMIDAKVKTGDGYGIVAESLNITGLDAIDAVTVRMWGVPGDPAHDGERYCRPTTKGELGYGTPPCAESTAGLPETPFLTTPTSCTGTLTATVSADAYQSPGNYVTESTTAHGMEGCKDLHFTPSLSVVPKSSSADSATGLHVRLHVPQEESATTLAEANMKDAIVTLPRGVTINPSEAAGLVGCSEAQIGYLASESTPPGSLRFTEAPGECPAKSKIGKVVLETPLFPQRKFEGGIYIAQQGNGGAALGTNPFGSLLAIYIAIDEPETGVVIKLAGHVELLAGGQLKTTFENNPQLPFENLDLTFFGGERAALATPAACGQYQAGAVLTSWAEPAMGVEPLVAPFDINTGPGGGACAAPGFAPSFNAGTAGNQAGSFSPFVMTLSRKDGEQRLSTVAMTMPKGVAGMLSKVPLCTQAQAEANACPAASQVGHVQAKVGVGGSPDTLPEAGRQEDPVYLLGKTEEAPFGLAIVVHPEAGPFNLEESGKPVIVLAKIEVNETTAQVSVISKPMPTELQGIPVDVKAIHIVIDRSGFMFNPTNCEPMGVAGTIGSAEGDSTSVSSRFQAAGCQALPFKPKFSALVHAHHTRHDGDYLHVLVKSGPGQANIASVEVKLPKRLPSRNSTLKLACTEAQFAKNPKGCPAGSKVGVATAYTPVLPVPLKGPAIFVSHGGRAYPDLDLVLKGDGVTVVLTGNTHINGKTNITTSYFRTVPDVPISRFDLVLPEQSNSALAGIGNLCYRTVTKKKRVRVRRHGKWVHVTKKVHHEVRRRMQMPTTITGQNGAVIKQDTTVAVTGCGKHKAKSASHKRQRRHGKQRRGK